MAQTARIGQAELERHFKPLTVRQLFSDAGTKDPGPRLAASCMRASRLAEGALLGAWTLEQIDVLFAEDEGIVALTCSLAMACGAEGITAWSGPGAPFEGLYKRTMSELKEIAAGQLRSRGESKGAGTNPTITGRIRTVGEPAFVFAPTRSNPRRGGY